MFNHSRLKLARIRRGLTKVKLADRAEIAIRMLTRYEAGSVKPPDEVVKLLAHELRFPESFFDREDPDIPRPATVSFRAMASMTARKRNAAIGSAALAIELADWITTRFDLPAPDLPAVHEPTPEVAADALRMSWGLGERPVKSMVHLLESHGVRVFSLPKEGRDVDAFSFWRANTPFVFLNPLKSAEHGRFDAAHELGHLLLHRHGGPRGREAEADANAFASSFLMPRASVVAVAPRLLTVDRLIALKSKWNVSVAALNHRLHQLKLTTEWQYRVACVEISERGFRKTEPKGSSRETSQVLQKVFQSLRKDNLGREELANILCIPPSDLDALVFGLVMTHLPGNPEAPPTQERNAHLRRL